MIDELYGRHKEELERFACAISRSGKEAEDLLQETFLRALTHSVKLSTLTQSQQRAWLYKVLKNIFYDRRRKSRFEVSLNEWDDPADDIDFSIGIEIAELLQLLPPSQYDIVYKRYFLGMTSKQIADQLGVPPGTVRFRLHTALNTLRNSMSPPLTKAGRKQDEQVN